MFRFGFNEVVKRKFSAIGLRGGDNLIEKRAMGNQPVAIERNPLTNIFITMFFQPAQRGFISRIKSQYRAAGRNAIADSLFRVY